MRIPRLNSPTACVTILVVFFVAGFCAGPHNPFEVRTLAAGKVSPSSKRATADPQAEQTITFPSVGSKNLGDASFAVNVSASSGLEVTLTAIGHCAVQGTIVELTGVGSCTLTASQPGDDDYEPAPNVSRSFFIGNPGETVIDVSNYGATGDGTTDDAPAFQHALDALASAGGGTLFVPPGRYALVTPITKTFTGLAASIAVQGVESDTLVSVTGEGSELADGLHLTSEIYPKTANLITFQLAGLDQLFISNVAFVGSPDVYADMWALLHLSEIREATIHHCEFYGLRSSGEGAGIIMSVRSSLNISQTKFLGTFGDSSLNTPVVQNLEWKNFSASDVVFLDYGMRPELYCKCDGSSYAWVNLGNAAATTADSPRREASFRNVFMDEGAFVGLFTLPAFYDPPSAPIDLVYISGLHMNVSNLGATGLYLSQVEHVLVEKSNFGWSQNAGSAMELLDAGNAILDQVECVDAANTISANSDTERLTVINSIYTNLNSQAQMTKTLTVSAENDPVQYVRSQFQQMLGREPDPAAHFYWSDLLLQCGDNAQCVADQHSALSQYLSTAPAPNFALSGDIKDDQGVPLAGALVSLTGSQSVTTLTDGAGHYSFSGLPTSGVYTIVPSQLHHTFQNPNATIITPAGDQAVDFEVEHNRYQIKGHVLNAVGDPLEGASVALSGSASASTVTDADGAYVLTAEAEGDYTVTTAKRNYAFSPGTATLNDLAGDQIADFTGSLVNYAVSGRVTNNGAGLSGVTVTLSGSQTGTATTDSDGNFVFGVQAEGDYTVTPILNGFSFAPLKQSYVNLSANQSGTFVANVQASVEFSEASYTVNESTADAVIAITRSGNTTGPASVKFATVDSAGLQDCSVTNGIASPRCDYSFTASTIQFAPGEVTKTIAIPIIDGAYAEGNESFTVVLTDSVGANLGAKSSVTVVIIDNDSVNGPNPVVNTDFFIRQHYLDFLGREPDQAGYDGWRNILNNCGITVPQPCDRIEVSSAFFRSPEFQGRGYFVYRFYSTVGKVPRYEDFIPDLATLSGFLTDEQLEANKVAFTNAFMDRPEFHSKYDAMSTPSAYVDGLLQTVGLPSHPSRQVWIDGLTSGSLTRAQVLRGLVDSAEMYQKYYNEAFVVMQYFGYLRRTADASYLQWVQTMNANGGDYRVMVNGFLNSLEYRQRFGP